MANARVVVGIDPGTAITGYGIIREQENGDLEWVTHGVVKTPSDWDEPQRLLEIYLKLKDIFASYNPDFCAVEKLFFQKNVKTAIQVGQDSHSSGTGSRGGISRGCRS